MLLKSDGTTHFYHGSARKIVTAFGSMFNNIILKRYDESGTAVKAIKVPINYEGKQHFIARIRDDNNKSSNTGIDTNVTIPAISFSLESLTYDLARQKNALGYTINRDTKERRWSPTPYIYNFNLTIYANKTEDGLQIIEQIVPWFTPELNMAIKMVDEVIDVPIELNDISFEDNWNEGFSNNRMITWNLAFSAKGLFFKPTTSPTVINRVVVDFHDDPELDTPIEFGSITQIGGTFNTSFSKAFI